MKTLTMTRSECQAFLAEVHVGILAVAEPGRGPIASPVWYGYTPGGPIRAGGTFRLRERFAYRYRDATERFRVRVDGRFTTSGVSGTFSVKATARARGSGRVVGRCRTGRQSFAAGL